MTASLPLQTATALLAAFKQLGLDADEARATCAVPVGPAETLLNASVWDALWAFAHAKLKAEETPTLVAFAIPFGAFGMVDYLASTAQNVRGGLQALSDHFRTVAIGFKLDVDLPDEGDAVVSVASNTGTLDLIRDEFTIATVVGRFTAVSANLRFEQIALSRPSAPKLRHSALLHAPVTYSAARCSVTLSQAMLDAPLTGSDPALHATLKGLAERLDLGRDATDLEQAINSRLRALLPNGRATAPAMARSLGMSERTLHRRLNELGHSYQDVIDKFRLAESERLLLANESLAAIALALGFSDQSTWTRAFKKWKAVSPAEWLAHRRAELG